MAQSTKRERNPYPAKDPFGGVCLTKMSGSEIIAELREWLLDKAEIADSGAIEAEEHAKERTAMAAKERTLAANLREAANGL